MAALSVGPASYRVNIGVSGSVSVCSSIGSGVGSAVGERGHGSAYLQISGVPRNG